MSVTPLLAGRSIRRAVLSATALVAIALAAWAAPAGAAVITVNTFDQFDGPLCTLAEAIQSANANADTGGCTGVGPYGADTVVLPKGTYALTQPFSGADGLPVITGDLVVEGNGATVTRTLGTSPPFFRIFHVVGATVTLNRVTVSGGRVEGVLAEGGGILVEGLQPAGTVREERAEGFAVRPSLHVTNSVVRDNHVNGSTRGGGMSARNLALVRMRDTEVSGNSVTSTGEGRGGGVSLEDIDEVDVKDVVFVLNAVQAVFGTGAALDLLLGLVLGTQAEGAEPPSPATVKLTALEFRDNVVTASQQGSGGALSSFGGEAPIMNIRFSRFTGNRVAGGSLATGGAASFFYGAACGVIDVERSTFESNSVATTGPGGGQFAFGGAISAQLPPGIPLNVSNSAVNGNTATAADGFADGGAVKFQGLGAGSDLNVTSSTFANNQAVATAGAQGTGGAISMAGTGTFLDVTNSTLSTNHAQGPGAAGGATFVQQGATFRPQNSIVSGNTAEGTVTPAISPDCARATTGLVGSLGRNLVGTAGSCVPLHGTDVVGAAVNLGAFTAKARVASGHFPLLPGSAALDAADAAGCPARDQLGQARQGACDIGAVERVPSTPIVFSALPITRTGAPGEDVTFFFTAINAGTTTAYRVGLDSLVPLATAALGAELAVTGVPATFTYQTTDATNALVGTIETPIDIPPGGVQSYVLALRPTAPFGPVNLALGVDGPNAVPTPPIVGVSTVLVSADDPKPADVVALAAANAGIVDLAPVSAAIPGAEVTSAGVFAVATVNLGAGGPITVTADTGSAALPLTVFLCQTDPLTGQCLGPLVTSLVVDIATNATPTFGFFPTTEAVIPFDPAVNRIFVRFTDAGGVVRGGTSVAVRTL